MNSADCLVVGTVANLGYLTVGERAVNLVENLVGNLVEKLDNRMAGR